jgi:hypothetical protein
LVFVFAACALWQRRRLVALRPRAATLVARMAPHAPWGWKDPRLCLTLPFWRTIVPDLHVVACVRDVSAVVRSLHRRGRATDEFGVSLWVEYNRRLIRAARADAPS